MKPFFSRILAALLKARRLSRKSITYRVVMYYRHQWKERFTPAGRFVLIAGSTTAIAGVFPEAMIGSYTFSAFMAVVFVAWAASAFLRPRVGVSRTAPPRVVAGSTATMRIDVTNTSRRDLYDLAAFEFRLPEGVQTDPEPSYIASLPRGASHTFSYQLQANRRGVYQMNGATALSAFPFGLMNGFRFNRQPHRLLVYPAFHKLVRLDLPVGQRYQPGGIVLTSHVGESMEFVGNREYRPGDRLRDLHPRSWARVGFPVVRQFQEEFLTRIAIVVDTHSPVPPPWQLPRVEGQTGWKRFVALMRMTVGDVPEQEDRPLEAALSLTAAIADHLARQEYVVDLFAAGPDLYHIQAGRSLAYLDNILDILACIERSPKDPFDVIGPKFREELREIATVVVVLMDWDDRRREFVESILRTGSRVKVVIVSDRFEPGQMPGPDGPMRCVRPEDVEKGIEQL